MRQALYEQIVQVRSRSRHGRSRGKANRKQQSQVKWERGQTCLLVDVLPADPVPSPASVSIPPKPRHVSEGGMRALAAITGREIASEGAAMTPEYRDLFSIPEGAVIGQGTEGTSSDEPDPSPDPKSVQQVAVAVPETGQHPDPNTDPNTDPGPNTDLDPGNIPDTHVYEGVRVQ